MNNNVRITVYENFIKDALPINAWTLNECFPIQKYQDTRIFDQFCVIEMTLMGTQGDNSKYNAIVDQFNFLIKNFLFSQEWNKLLFSKGSIQYRSRIRSYIGIYPREIEKHDYIQFEYELEKNQSIIEGLLNVSKHNYDSIKSSLFWREDNFILLTKEDYFTKETIANINLNVLNNPSYVVNYLNLCLEYCDNKDNIIVRETGDGGDQEFSWQFFLNKSYQYDILNIVNNLFL